ncbi:MAG: acylneuraminate cytidylyltransferase family protein [Deltaproteobacteria bacterium]|nr:acylneuraminate cytidylyltransferase family protein [Deltaproteobacteria bacterium]
MKILAVIPARGGSKGVRLKNIRMLGGKPLISHIIESAKQSKHIDRMILSTEDEDIMKIGQQMGVDIPFIRPLELASDDSPLIAVVFHAYQYFKERDIHYDAVLSLQPTSPFLKPTSIDKMIELWNESGCESVTTISEITTGHPYISKELLPGNIIKNFFPLPDGFIVGARQKRPKVYYLTGAAYLRDKRLLEITEKKGHALGTDARAVVLDELEAVDINSEFELKFAEFLIGSQNMGKTDISLNGKSI